MAAIAQDYTDYLMRAKAAGLHFIQPGRFVLPGEMAGAPALQFFPWPQREDREEGQLAQADKRSNIGMLRERYRYYCQQVVKGFYKQHFSGFDRQIVLVDCLAALNHGPDAFNDMRLALTQLMRSFHYCKRSLYRRLFSPCIDKLMFAASKADHVTADQHANLVALLQQLVKDSWQNAAFEGISMDCEGGGNSVHSQWRGDAPGAKPAGTQRGPAGGWRAADILSGRSAGTSARPRFLATAALSVRGLSSSGAGN